MTTDRPNVLLLMADDTFAQLFDAERLRRLAASAAPGADVHAADLAGPDALARFARAEVLITGWGVPTLTAELLDAATRLRAVLHAAGSVKAMLPDDAAWRRGLLVTSAAEANAVPVAEFTLAAVLQAGKRVLDHADAYRRHAGAPHDWRTAMPPTSNYGRTVGIVGLSRIGRRVARLLQGHDVRVLAYDPYADSESATALGVTLVPLDDLLARSEIVTLHAPALPSTRHMLDAARLALLPDGATLVNTARGALVDTDALTAECVSGRLTAVLDVTEPEPLPAGSPLYTLPNVQLTPHIAGALGTEVRRLADAALDELERYRAGSAPLYPVTAADLARIA